MSSRPRKACSFVRLPEELGFGPKYPPEIRNLHRRRGDKDVEPEICLNNLDSEGFIVPEKHSRLDDSVHLL